MNTQDNRYCCRENHLLCEVQLHDIKIDVWCAQSGKKFLGPVFHADTINPNISYVDMSKWTNN
jgi:hypothetical protein